MSGECLCKPGYAGNHCHRYSFDGDVVLDSFNMSCKNEDIILEQMYEKQISLL